MNRRIRHDARGMRGPLAGHGVAVLCLAIMIAAYVLLGALWMWRVSRDPHDKALVGYLYVVWPVLPLVLSIVVGAVRGENWMFPIANMLLAIMVIWFVVNGGYAVASAGEFLARLTRGDWDWGWYLMPGYALASFGGFGLGRLIRRARARRVPTSHTRRP